MGNDAAQHLCCRADPLFRDLIRSTQSKQRILS
jgi:hypothetical protein